MKHLLKRNNKEISAYLLDKQIECFTFNIIQHHPTTKNNDSDKDVLLHSGRNKCLIKHCIVVLAREEADRYISFCSPMFLPSNCFSQPSFKVKSAQILG